MKLSILHRYTLICLTALASCACSSDPEPPATNNGSSTTSPIGGSSTTSGLMYCDPTPIMADACSGVVCHGSAGKPPFSGTDLFNPPEGQTMGQSLINKPANYNLVADPTSCPTATPEVLINPSAPSESLVIKKIMGTFACGVKMPNTNRVLTQAELDCFVDWVNGVITENGGTVTTGGTPTAASTTTSTSGTMTSAVTTTGTSTTTGGTTTAGTVTTGAVTTTGTSSTTGTATTGGDPYPPTWETMLHTITYSTIFCGASDCHGGFEGRLDLREDEGLYTRLTTWTSEVCDNKLVVNPGNPEQSAILDVLTTGCGNVYPGCKIGEECIPQMPIDCQPGFDCIATEKIDAVRQWIADGAPGPQ